MNNMNNESGRAIFFVGQLRIRLPRISGDIATFLQGGRAKKGLYP